MAERKLPFPLLILTALFGFSGLLLLLGGALLILEKQPLYGCYSLIKGLVAFYIGYGLYNFSKTAWIVAVAFELIGIISGLVQLGLGSATLSQTVVSVIIDAIILFVLLHYSRLYGISLGKPTPTPTPSTVVDTKSMKFFRKLE